MAFPTRRPGTRVVTEAELSHVALIASEIFASAIDHAPLAHAFSYNGETVLEATASARQYAVAQARALLDEVDAQLSEGAKRCTHTWAADRSVVPPGDWYMRCSNCGATKSLDEDAER